MNLTSYLDLVLEDSIGVELQEELIGGHVESGDNFLRISHHLRIQLCVVTPQVVTVHAQEWLLQHVDLGREEVDTASYP